MERLLSGPQLPMKSGGDSTFPLMGPEGRGGEGANGRPLGAPCGVAGTGRSMILVGHLSVKHIVSLWTETHTSPACNPGPGSLL